MGGKCSSATTIWITQSPRDLYEKQRDKIDGGSRQAGEEHQRDTSNWPQAAAIKCSRCCSCPDATQRTSSGTEAPREASAGRRGYPAHRRRVLCESSRGRGLRLGEAAIDSRRPQRCCHLRLLTPPKKMPRHRSADEPEATDALRRKIVNLPHIRSDEHRELMRTELVKRQLYADYTEDQHRRTQPQMSDPALTSRRNNASRHWLWSVLSGPRANTAR